MADAWFDIGKIKVAMKRAGNGPIPFAFGVGSSLDECKLAMHLKRPPAFLGKALKGEGFSPSRILLGTAETNGPLLIVTTEKEIPKAKKSIKYFLKQNKMLQKKVQLMGPDGEFDAEDDEDELDTTGVAEPEDDELDGAWFDIGKIKVAMKRAGNGPIPFAFGVGGSLDECQLAMHLKRPPAFLGKALKGEGFSPARILIGTAETSGPLLTVTTEKEIPKSKKAIRYFLKQNKMLQKKVLLIGPNGEFDVGEDEDDLDIDVAAPAKSSDEEQAAFKRRFAEVTPLFKKALTERGAEAKPLADKFKQAHALGKTGDYGRALALLDELDELLEGTPTPQADALSEEWTKRVKKLAPQIKEVLTAKLEGSRDIALKFKEAQGFQSKQDFETGIAMLDEISIMIENLKGGDNQHEAEWTQRFKKLEPDLASVLQQNLGDPSKLRAARDMAIEKADSGDHVTALKILDRLQPAVAQALASAGPPGEDKQAETKKPKIAPGIAFTQSRLAWDTARKKIKSDLELLEKAIHDATKDDDPGLFAEVQGKTGQLYDILGERDEELMDKLDEGLNAEKDSPAQHKAYGEASKLVKDYVGFVNGSPLVQEIDSNPFKPVAVKKTIDATLKVLASRLAA